MRLTLKSDITKKTMRLISKDNMTDIEWAI